MKSRLAVTASIGVALRSACFIAVAVGIFGMHALATCGVGGMASMAGMPLTSMSSIAQTADPTSSAASASSASDMVDHARMDPGPRDGEPLGVGNLDDSGMGMPMVEWCLAVLLVGLGVVLSFRRRRRERPAWVLPRFARRFAVIERTSRHLASPSLSQLSILRC